MSCSFWLQESGQNWIVSVMKALDLHLKTGKEFANLRRTSLATSEYIYVYITRVSTLFLILIP